MSWTDEELDNLVRNASKQVPNPVYQDEYFDEIADLLPKRKQNKRWLLLFFIPFVFLPLLFHQNDVSSLKHKSPKKNKTIAYQKLKNESFDTNIFQVPATSSKDMESISTNNLEYKSFIKEFTNKQIVYQTPEYNQITSFDRNKSADVEDQFVNSLQLIQYVPSEKVELNRSPFLMIKSKVKNRFFVNGSLGFSESLIESSKVKPSLKIDLGLGYQRLFKNCEGELGLNLVSLLPQQMNLSKSSKVYGVKINRYKQTISYQAIYALEMPIQISKTFARNKFSVGISPQYYLGSRLVVLQSRNDESLTEKSYFLNKFGLSSFAMKYNVSYLHLISKNIEIGVNISLIENNLLNEKDLSVENNKMVFSGQLTLRKYFKLR